MTNKDLFTHLSTSTLRAIYNGLRLDKADLKASQSLGNDTRRLIASLATIDEAMADIVMEVSGHRGEIV